MKGEAAWRNGRQGICYGQTFVAVIDGNVGMFGIGLVCEALKGGSETSHVIAADDSNCLDGQAV